MLRGETWCLVQKEDSSGVATVYFELGGKKEQGTGENITLKTIFFLKILKK
jgi:hypothetical protein